jgi:hypothetical protein
MTNAGFGFLYEPSNENEVRILFGLVMPYLGEAFEELGFGGSECYLDEFSDGDPDCILVVDGKKVGTEFEFESYTFHEHGHDPKKCDLIVCWKHTWINYPKKLKILELSTFLKKLDNTRELHLVLNEKPKYPKRSLRWSIQEFMSKLKENVSDPEFTQLKAFINEISQMDGVLLQTGKGKKIPTIGIGFKQQGDQFPLNLEATGKAFIAYYNVNAKPPYPLMREETMRRIKDLLGEQKKQWHYIRASTTTELVDKLKAIVKIMLQG